jgi:hypothetical protein
VLFSELALLVALQSAPAQRPQQQQAQQQQQQSDRRTWYQAYADAQRAIQAMDWQKALADLDAAARRGAPRPGRNVLFYGDVYRDYNPDYYRGIAYTNLNRFAEAATAFDRVSQAQLITARDPLYQEFTRQVTLARDGAQKQGTQPNAPTAVAANQPPPNATQTGVNNPNVNNAANAPGVNAARPTANPPPSNVPLNAPPNAAPTAVAANPAANVEQRPPAAAPDPKQDAVQPPSNQVRRPPQAPQAPQARPNAAPRAPVTPPPSATATLDDRRGVLQFFSGDYAAAATSLTALVAGLNASNASPASRRERAYFYLACAQAALVLTGGAPRSAITDARAQLTRANDTGQYGADKRLISPRIKQELGMRP